MSTAPARVVFWQRTLRLTAGLLLVWLSVSLLVPWFARDMDGSHGWGFPAGFWLASEGALLLYLLIIVAYVVAMERLEAAYLRAIEAPPAGPDSA